MDEQEETRPADLPGQRLLFGRPAAGSDFIKQEEDVMATATNKAESRESRVEIETPEGTWVGLPNGEAAWECGSCGEKNEAAEWICLTCGEFAPGRAQLAEMLTAALEPDTETEAVWAELRYRAATDDKLAEAIHAALVRQPQNRLSTPAGIVTWVTGPEHEALAGSIGFWFGDREPETRPADLIGADLLYAVRCLYQVHVERPRKERVKEQRAEREELPGHARDDKRVNEHGVYVRGGKTIVVPIPKAAKHSCVIKVVEGQDGRFRTGYSFKGPEGVSGYLGSAPSARHEGHDTERAAIRHELEHAILTWSGEGATDPKKLRPKAVAAVRKYLQGLEIHYLVCEDGNEKKSAGGAGKKTAKAKKKRVAKKKKIAAAAGNGEQTADVAAGTRLDVPLAQIVPSPFQPRTQFDEAAIAELAASLTAHGQTSDCLVRQVRSGPERPVFELIGGERRFRAAQKAKLKTLGCKVVVADDAKARELAVFDNLDREDLSELDRIRAYQGLLDAGVYGTQQELAEAIGIKPASLSNLLRILRLPEKWLGYISQEKLPLTHARYLVPWAERPAVLEELQQVVEAEEDMDGIGPIDWWKQDVERAVRDATRPLSGTHTMRIGGLYRQVKVRLTKKDKEREDLDVVDVQGLGKRAFNVDLWEELQQAGEERAAKRAASKSSSPAKTTDKEGKPLSAAEIRRREEQKEKSFAKRIWIYKIEWLQQRVAEKIGTLEPAAGGEDQRRMLALLLYFSDNSTSQAELHPTDAVFAAGASPAKGGGLHDWSDLLRGDCRQLWEASRNCAAAWVLQTPWSNYSGVDDRTIETLAETFDVEIKRDWGIDEAYLQLLNKSQLLELAEEWKVTKRSEWTAMPREKKSELIAGLVQVGQTKRLKCPKGLAAAKRPAGVCF